jgi:sulfur carrier protein
MHVNGVHITLKESITLSGFLLREGHDPERVAVEKNGKIVSRASFDTETVSDDDVIEIVCFVGGG